ncbi:DENN (AEX-3) domain-containing protein [Giardia muris]|uniref:DENN (AEX-3) domain-containing protein n=1 Tax=Giardia muris TaxID=5742 RepID=A0A4Z1SUR9_GIAMU|nr:DENN (AEX-3) domain-containing protein [Giardia muris]|eukprot:TNJ29564.1 DENN (AEX-3) domain-containing protein [Giardia muris]
MDLVKPLLIHATIAGPNRQLRQVLYGLPLEKGFRVAPELLAQASGFGIKRSVPQYVSQFAFPVGVPVSSEPLPPTGSPHYFVYTSYKGSVVWGVSLLVAQTLTAENAQWLCSDMLKVTLKLPVYTWYGVLLLMGEPRFEDAERVLAQAESLFAAGRTHLEICQEIVRYGNGRRGRTASLLLGGQMFLSHPYPSDVISPAQSSSPQASQTPQTPQVSSTDYTNPMDTTIFPTTFNLVTIFSLVAPEVIVKTVEALLQSRPVIFIGDSLRDISLCVLEMWSLLAPFAYPYPILPVLPAQQLYLLHAPFPVLAGVYRDVLFESVLSPVLHIVDLATGLIVQPSVALREQLFLKEVRFAVPTRILDKVQFNFQVYDYETRRRNENGRSITRFIYGLDSAIGIVPTTPDFTIYDPMTDTPNGTLHHSSFGKYVTHYVPRFFSCSRLLWLAALNLRLRIAIGLPADSTPHSLVATVKPVLSFDLPTTSDDKSILRRKQQRERNPGNSVFQPAPEVSENIFNLPPLPKQIKGALYQLIIQAAGVYRHPIMLKQEDLHKIQKEVSEWGATLDLCYRPNPVAVGLFQCHSAGMDCMEIDKKLEEHPECNLLLMPESTRERTSQIVQELLGQDIPCHSVKGICPNRIRAGFFVTLLSLVQDVNYCIRAVPYDQLTNEESVRQVNRKGIYLSQQLGIRSATRRSPHAQDHVCIMNLNYTQLEKFTPEFSKDPANTSFMKLTTDLLPPPDVDYSSHTYKLTGRYARLFDYDIFLASLPTSWQPFIRYFVDTPIFDSYLESRILDNLSIDELFLIPHKSPVSTTFGASESTTDSVITTSVDSRCHSQTYPLIISSLTDSQISSPSVSSVSRVSVSEALRTSRSTPYMIPVSRPNIIDVMIHQAIRYRAYMLQSRTDQSFTFEAYKHTSKWDTWPLRRFVVQLHMGTVPSVLIFWSRPEQLPVGPSDATITRKGVKKLEVTGICRVFKPILEKHREAPKNFIICIAAPNSHLVISFQTADDMQRLLSLLLTLKALNPFHRLSHLHDCVRPIFRGRIDRLRLIRRITKELGMKSQESRSSTESVMMSLYLSAFRRN